MNESKKFYDVMCISRKGMDSEDVEYTHTDSEDNLHGIVVRTEEKIEFWWDDDLGFLGVTYEKLK